MRDLSAASERILPAHETCVHAWRTGYAAPGTFDLWISQFGLPVASPGTKSCELPRIRIVCADETDKIAARLPAVVMMGVSRG
jgi:hypothetical protein